MINLYCDRGIGSTAVQPVAGFTLVVGLDSKAEQSHHKLYDETGILAQGLLSLTIAAITMKPVDAIMTLWIRTSMNHFFSYGWINTVGPWYQLVLFGLRKQLKKVDVIKRKANEK